MQLYLLLHNVAVLFISNIKSVMLNNPLSARAFFGQFFSVISQECINRIIKFCITFCRKFQALPRKSQIFFIIFTMSEFELSEVTTM